MPTESIEVLVPALHPAQRMVDAGTARYHVVCCGRRWGKSVLSRRRLLRVGVTGKPVAYFAPTYKMLSEYWRETAAEIMPVLDKANVQERRLQLLGGGIIDMWSLDEPNAARGRKYAHIAIDEAAMVPRLAEAWQEVIRPCLSDYAGTADFYSTPRGMDFFFQLWQRGQDALMPEWASWQMPTSANPFIAGTEIEAARLELPGRVFEQEFLAQFLEESGGVFRGVRQSVDIGRNRNEPAAPGCSYCLGVDLARVEDFTVLTVMDDTLRQVYHERFNQISWERQIASVVRVAGDYHAKVVIDSTGVGDPIFEALSKAGLNIEPFHFTSASKGALIDGLALPMEHGRLRLMDVPVQTNELLAYQYELTPMRNIRMNAPPGMHDDCVIGLALATWGQSQPVPWWKQTDRLRAGYGLNGKAPGKAAAHA